MRLICTFTRDYLNTKTHCKRRGALGTSEDLSVNRVRVQSSVIICAIIKPLTGIERVSIECRKTKTKVITLAYQKGRRQSSKLNQNSK